MDLVRSIGIKLKVHVSFAEADLPFVDRLLAVLNELGEFELSVTPDEDTRSSDGPKRARDLIAAADAVVFVLSPAAARSQTVAREAKLAQQMSKRVLTVLSQPADKFGLPTPYFDVKPIAMNTRQTFNNNVKQLVQSLNKDCEWIREHTALYARARHWQAAGHDPSLLLPGSEMIAAKMWTFERPDKAPKPTDLHIDFIRASEDLDWSPRVATIELPSEMVDARLQGNDAKSPERVQPKASIFAKLLQPRLPDNKAMADAGTAPDPTVETEPVSAQEPAAKTDHSPAKLQDPTAEKPELLLELDEWLREVPAAVPAVVARTIAAALPTVRGLNLDRLADAQSGVKVSRLPVGHLQPYREVAKPTAPICVATSESPNVPTTEPSDRQRKADFAGGNGGVPAGLKTSASPRVPRVSVRPRIPPPGMCPAAPRPLARQSPSIPAQCPGPPIPGSTPRAPRPCMSNVGSVPDTTSGPVAGPPSRKPSVSPELKPNLTVSNRPNPHASALGRTGPVELVPIAAAKSAECPSTKGSVKTPSVRPDITADSQLEDLLASFFAQDDDSLKFQ